MTSCLLAALTTLTVPSADMQDEKALKELLDKLQGRWSIVLMHDRGKKIEVKKEFPSEFVIKGNKWLRTGGEDIATLYIYPGIKPIAIDLKVTGEGEEKGRTLEGIFEIDEDTLRWCFYEKVGEKRRPVSFPENPDPDVVLYLCKRVKQ
jgi:uncharacterized protein (TIGR03067 family)